MRPIANAFAGLGIDMALQLRRNTRESCRRIEAGRRRVAEAKGEAYVPLPPLAYVPGLTLLADAILRGRERARQNATWSPG
jgi:hypothetical protein